MKIKDKYIGAIIRDPKIGRALEVTEKNLPTLIAYGHDYVVEMDIPKETIKKKLKNDIKVSKKRNKPDSSDSEGTTDS